MQPNWETIVSYSVRVALGCTITCLQCVVCFMCGFGNLQQWRYELCVIWRF